MVCIDDEIPFEIPTGWEWCRLKEVIQLLSGRDLEPSQYNNEGVGIPYMTGASNFTNDKLVVNRWTKGPVTVSHSGDLLITCKGTIGTMSFNDIGDIHIARQIMGISSLYVNLQYVKLFLEIYVVELQKAARSIIPGISRDDILSAILPLPPTKEQKRIVDKINEILPIVKRYSIYQIQQDELNSKIKSLLRKSILQEAIQGKLIPQDPNDEPASVLLQHIKEEKLRLVKEGKLKKKDVIDSIIFKGDDNKYYENVNGKVSDITDQIPFDIPNSWRWVRLGQIGDWGAGATPARGTLAYYQNGTIPWLKTGELNNGIVYDSVEHITDKALQECSLRLANIGDVLIAMYGATIGKLAIAGAKLTTNQACCGCTPFNGVFNKYLFYFLMANKDTFLEMGAGGAQPNISREKIVRFLFALPPENEQYRIVSMIDDLFQSLN